jgi:hypothetical protein
MLPLEVSMCGGHGGYVVTAGVVPGTDGSKKMENGYVFAAVAVLTARVLFGCFL